MPRQLVHKKIASLIVALILPASTLAQSPQPLTEPQNSRDACPVKSLLFDFEVQRFGGVVGELPIWRLGEEDSAFFFSAGMAIDADGAPNAYNAENTGLDDLSSAGQTGHWDGVLQDRDGNPLVQGPNDPFPGYYISCTALEDWSKDRFDPTRFVDASKIPYVALPGELARATGARLGDFATVFNMRNGRFSHAIFADIGTLGEGSIALADNLGLWSNARAGGAWAGIVYVVFPGSGDHRPKSIEEINEVASKLFLDWGGADRVRSCADVETFKHRPRPTLPTPWDPQPIRLPNNSTSESKPGTTSAAATTPNTNSN
jgi:hypothetical protein